MVQLVKSILGKYMAKNYAINFNKLGCNINVRVYYLLNHFDCLPEKLEVNIDQPKF